MTDLQFEFYLQSDMKQDITILRYCYTIAEIIAMPEEVRMNRVKYEIEKGV